MIKPGKHLNLNVCVLRIASIILAHLQRHRIEGCTVLLKKVKDAAGNDAEVWFLPALDFLFLLGRIDYRAKNDTFEYLAPRQKAVK